jgi:branched-subunit amino acid aminotransferase/4-amino-4-deoxychorismate lyase
MDLPPLETPPPFVLARASFRRDETCPTLRHKSLSYQANVLALAEARRRGADEVYFLNFKGHLAENATTNLFFVQGGTVRTPDDNCGLLPGITRDIVMELCGRAGIPCERGCYDESALCNADEVFCTNSLRGIVGVKGILDLPQTHLSPGPITLRIQRLYAELVHAECGS